MPKGIYNHFKTKGKGNPFYGKKHSPEALEKMRQANLGRISPNKGKFGKLNPNWKNGIVPIEYYRRLRMSVVEALGRKCVRCGFSDERALQIDHINGGGNKDKKSFKNNYYKAVIKSFLAGENKYQLLCANCNWIKRVENKEVRNGLK